MSGASRRTLIMGGFAGLMGGCQVGQEQARPVTNATNVEVPRGAAIEAPGRLQVFYVSAWNCPVCPNFDLAHMQPYERSAEAGRVPLRRVVVPNFRNIWTSGGYWPDDLEWVRVQAPGTAFPGGNYGTPHTILIRGATILERRFSVRGWTDFVHPRLMREVQSV